MNDEGALGREVNGVVDPETQKPIDREDLEAWPTVVDAITKDSYRPTFAACGDSVTFTLNETGHIKGWGVFRVCSMFLPTDRRHSMLTRLLTLPV